MNCPLFDCVCVVGGAYVCVRACACVCVCGFHESPYFECVNVCVGAGVGVVCVYESVFCNKRQKGNGSPESILQAVAICQSLTDVHGQILEVF